MCTSHKLGEIMEAEESGKKKKCSEISKDSYSALEVYNTKPETVNCVKHKKAKPVLGLMLFPSQIY